MKVLIAEDFAPSARLLEAGLRKAGHDVEITKNGVEALAALARAPFDALLTDWMMPEMDGIELIRRVRASVRPVPIIMLVTSLSQKEDRDHALRAGADDYLVKPQEVRSACERLAACLARRDQRRPLRAPVPSMPGGRAAPRSSMPVPHVVPDPPPYAGVVIASSTGGPLVLLDLFRLIRSTDRAAFFVLQHGPGWMLETLAERLQEQTAMRVRLGADGVAVAPGEIYVAPGERHMQIVGRKARLCLLDGPPENYVRPAADPLLRSVAQVFGRRALGVVLTGLGSDGAAGCEELLSSGGKVLVQDPATAFAPSMPKSVVEACPTAQVLPLPRLPLAISQEILQLAAG